jgi:hypothetical protein
MREAVWRAARRTVFAVGRAIGWLPQRLAMAALRIAYANSSPRVRR